jgi:hypothetical protein
MTPQKRTPDTGGAAGVLEDVSFATEHLHIVAEAATQNQALCEAKRDLIRQALFEDLDAVRIYAETAILLIEARDDFGTIYAIERGAAHYRAIIGAKKELGDLRQEGQ